MLWDVATSKVRGILLGHSDGVKSVAFSPDGALIATAGYVDELKLWRTETLAPIASIPATAIMTSIAFSPDGKYLAVSLDAFGLSRAKESPPAPENNAELYDVSTRSLTRRFKAHTEGLRVVAFHPNGRLLATGSDDGTARLWDVAAGREVAALVDQKLTDRVNEYWQRAAGRKIPDMTPNIESVAFSPDGKQLAVAGGVIVTGETEDGIGSVTLWDVEARSPQATLPDYGCSVNQVQFSPDGKVLATAGRDGYVRFWDTVTWRQTGRFRGFAPIAFSPDGDALLSTTDEPSLVLRRVWPQIP